MRSGGAQGDAAGSDGFALVFVLGFLLVASAIITPFAVAARTNYLIAANIREMTRLDAKADAIAVLVSHYVGRTSLDEGELPFHGNASCTVLDHEIMLRLQSQAGLIDLNGGEEALIAAGFRALGFDILEGDDLASLTVQHRGYEDGFGDREPLIPVEAGLKRAPLESVAELHDFNLVDDLELPRLREVFTVHSRLGSVNADVVSPALARELDTRIEYGEWLTTASSPSMPFALEVLVRSEGRAARGYAGYIIQPSDDGELVSRLEPLSEDGGGFAGSSAGACPPLFREAFLEVLELAGR